MSAEDMGLDEDRPYAVAVWKPMHMLTGGVQEIMRYITILALCG
jgi:hypothetical protein